MSCDKTTSHDVVQRGKPKEVHDLVKSGAFDNTTPDSEGKTAAQYSKGSDVDMALQGFLKPEEVDESSLGDIPEASIDAPMPAGFAHMVSTRPAGGSVPPLPSYSGPKKKK